MGVIHKLKPEVLSFIVEHKQKNPALSCRQLVVSVLEQFQVKISKSSINAIFKENNLSMPIGRRRKQKKVKFNLPPLPVIEGTKSMVVVTPPEASAPVVANEDMRINEAEAWAQKLQEEDRLRVEEKLRLEKEKLKIQDLEQERILEESAQDAFEAKRLAEEVLKLREAEVARAALEAKRLAEEGLKLQEVKIAQAALEAKRLAEEALKLQEAEIAQAALEAKRLADEVLKLQEAEAAQALELIAEKEKWEKLAAAEHAIKHKDLPQEVKFTEIAPEVFKDLPQERTCSGAILLRALDSLTDGSEEINLAICKAIGANPQEHLNLTRALIFKSLFSKDNYSALGDLIGVAYPLEKLDSFCAQINQVVGIGAELAKIIANVFTQVKGVKVNFADATVANLDGQLHSSWSTFWFPYSFASPLNELKNNLNKYFIQEKNLVLFAAPGYDVLSKDFFGLISNMAHGMRPESLTLFGNELNELESIALNSEDKISLVFGLWPWQFTSTRKVKRIGEFSLKQVKGMDLNLYLGEIEIELLRASVNQNITLKGCAIKTNLSEKICLVVLSTATQPPALEDLAQAYLSHWPNFDEAFQDFSRKIELYTYTGKEQKFLTKDKFQISPELFNTNVEHIFASYLQMLDLYLRWYFLPADYLDKDFVFTSKRFYSLPVKLAFTGDKMTARMQLVTDDQYIKDLEYLFRRLNERQIVVAGDKKLWFESVFK